MAWLFGKNKEEQPEEPTQGGGFSGGKFPDANQEAEPQAPEFQAASLSTAPGVTPGYNADTSEKITGPFDGDSLNIDDFDFSDFALGILNLGSIRVPLPTGSQVQVEMGEQGPKMLHIVTTYGRMTPVAFAAPLSAGQWEEAIPEIEKGMVRDGLETEIQEGFFGKEVVGRNENGVVRIIGAEGPRWMLRITCAAPLDKEEEMAVLARETAARTFVYRGPDPVLAGNSLPVVLPEMLSEQVYKAMEERAKNNQGDGQPIQTPVESAEGSNTPDAAEKSE